MDISSSAPVSEENPKKRAGGRPRKSPPPPPMPDIPSDKMEDPPRQPLVDQSDLGSLTDDLDSDDEGDVGGGPSDDFVEPDPGLPPERSPSAVRPRREQFDVDRTPTIRATQPIRPVGASEDEIDELAIAIKNTSGNVRMRVTRLYPEDVPPNEVGPFQWAKIPDAKPSADRVREILERRFGGGQFHVEIADVNDSNLEATRRTILVPVGGDPIMQTADGRRWFKQKNGYDSALPSGGLIPEGSAKPAVAGAGGSNDIAAMALEMMKNERDRDAQAHERKLDRDTSLATVMLTNKGGGITEIIGALAPLTPIFVEMMRSNKESKDRAQERLEKILEKMSEQKATPGDAEYQMKMFEAKISLQDKLVSAELERAKKKDEFQWKVFLDSLPEKEGQDATWKGLMMEVVRAGGPKALEMLAPLIAQATAAKQGQPRPQGGVQQPPRLPGPRPGPVATPQLQQGQRMVPTPPPPTAEVPAPDAAQPPILPGPGATPPGSTEEPDPDATSAGSIPEPDMPPPPMQQVPRGRPSPVENAKAIAIQALDTYLYHLATFAQMGADPDVSWDAVVAGQSMDVWFGMCHPIFRKNLADVKVDEPFMLEPLVDGAPEPIVAIARDIDTLMSQSAEARKFVCEFLDCGPWKAGDDEDESEDD